MKEKLYVVKIINADDVNELINQIEEPEQEKVVIPQFVADWIETMKQQDFTLGQVAEHLYSGDIKWSLLTKYERWARLNFTKFTRAWLDGFSIEKEKLYRVVFPMGINPNKLIRKISTGAISIDSESYYSRDTNDEFTEQEIKAIDERYLAFKEEITT